jgi:hypothetical protein
MEMPSLLKRTLKLLKRTLTGNREFRQPRRSHTRYSGPE